MAKIQIDVVLNSKIAELEINKLKTGIQQIGKTLNEIKPDENLTKQLQAITEYYRELGKAASSYTRTIERQTQLSDKLINSSIRAVNNLQEKLSRNKSNYKNQTVFDDLNKDITKTINSLKQFTKEYHAYMAENGDKATPQYKQLLSTYTQLNGEIDALRTRYAQLTNEQEKNNEVLVKQNDSVLRLAKKFFQWQISATLVMQPIYKIRDAVSSLNETLTTTEQKIVAIQRVISGGYSNTQLSNSLYDLAQKYGQSFENVSEIAINFARTGMEWEKVLKASEAALTALNVAELDTTQATEGLIAIMNQFKIEATDLSSVVDILNKQADTASVTTQELLVGLQKTGSAAANANLSLTETVALITTLSETTGASGSVMGNAVRALLTYSSKTKSLDTFASLSDDMNSVVTRYRQGLASMLDIWKQLSKEMQNLSKEQADLIQTATSDLDSELSGELEEIYDKMKGVYDTAGTYRKNYFMALLSDLDTIQDKIDTTSNSLGYSREENLKYLNTYEAKVKQLQAQWEKIANDEQGILKIKKTLVDIGSVLLTGFKWVGGIKTAIVALTGVLAKFASAKIVKLIDNIANRGGLKNVLSISAKLTTLQQQQVLLEEQKLRLKELEQNKEANILAISQTQQAVEETTNTILTTRAAIVSSIVGWLSMGATIIASIVGIIKQNKQEQANQRQMTIDEFNNKVDEYSGLIEAAQKSVKDFSSAQNELASALGKSAEAFKDAGLSAGEYESKLKDLTATTLYSLYAQSMTALESARGQYENGVWERNKQTFGLEKRYTIGSYARNLINRNKAIERASQDTEYANSQGYKDYLSSVNDTLSHNQENILNYITTAAKNKGYAAYISDRDGIITKDEYEATIKRILKELQIGEQLAEESGITADIQSALNEIGYKVLESETQQEDNSNKVVSKLDKVIKELSGLADRLKEIKDTQDKNRELQELQDKLNNAERNQNIRYYNEKTGNWELMANQKEVQQASQNIYDWLREEAYNTILNAISEAEENGTGLSYNDTIKILDEWQEQRAGAINQIGGKSANDYIADITNEIVSFFGVEKELQKAEKIDKIVSGVTTAVDIIKGIAEIIGAFKGSSNTTTTTTTTVEEESKVKTPIQSDEITARKTAAKKKGGLYDNGGILSGLGGIKATTQDEIILPPDIASKILEPSSNSQFKAFTDSLGLLFGITSQIAQPSITPNGSGNITNNNGATYVINGVSIGQQAAETYTIAEIFRTMNLS